MKKVEKGEKRENTHKNFKKPEKRGPKGYPTRRAQKNVFFFASEMSRDRNEIEAQKNHILSSRQKEKEKKREFFLFFLLLPFFCFFSLLVSPPTPSWLAPLVEGSPSHHLGWVVSPPLLVGWYPPSLPSCLRSPSPLLGWVVSPPLFLVSRPLSPPSWLGGLPSLGGWEDLPSPPRSFAPPSPPHPLLFGAHLLPSPVVFGASLLPSWLAPTFGSAVFPSPCWKEKKRKTEKKIKEKKRKNEKRKKRKKHI